ncbi:hypothetical protein E1176_18245 [Fulvivirga sp. RKSG066]|uniref:DUF6010 family protein n=1 Tax=Fulvivirga aurantia TaxID=2529383 RepID=UPI0012BD1394|nr:DUF6010 family protein [Fulvivirga aurantia]MTI22977.1 hypothetical protein [Fulvivirga aurantia]
MTESFRTGMIWGLMLTVITITLSYFLPYEMVIELFAFAMVLIGSVYFGFAFKEDSRKIKIIELVSASGFVLTGILGLWINPWLIVAGLFMHGIWDLLHHNGKYLTKIPAWYIPLCVIYDWMAGGYLTYFLLSN